ncbi:MAG: hypothetical protein L0Y72_23175 [Gemmataceae bacterium]|nr:hypothetical protein [Gemmataceae bacterium]MCI0741946.1 hypothetical protein [Gemmataceae bacterium]
MRNIGQFLVRHPGWLVVLAIVAVLGIVISFEVQKVRMSAARVQDI